MKTSRRKTKKVTRRKHPAAARPRDSSATDLRRQLDQQSRELVEARKGLAEAVEQQTATSEVLSVISSSPGELEPVFQAMLANATRICQAQFGTLNLFDGEAFRTVALQNAPHEYAEKYLRGVMRPHPESGHGYVLRTKQIAHVADIRTERPYLDGNPAAVALA